MSAFSTFQTQTLTSTANINLKKVKSAMDILALGSKGYKSVLTAYPVIAPVSEIKSKCKKV